MALEGVGLGLALLSEVTSNIKSLQQRKACYKEAPALFAEVDETLTRLAGVVDEISSIVDTNPNTLPKAVRTLFVSTLSAVNETILQAGNAFNAYCAEAFFGGSGGGFFRAVASKGKRFFKAKSVAVNMNEIKRCTRHAESKLQSLLTQLAVALKADETAMTSNLNLRSAIEEHVAPCEKFRTGFNPPALPGNACLDFESKDDNGNFVAPEATLKSLVFISTSSRPVTVAGGANDATGTQLAVHGVSGLAGVGKTVALMALGHDVDIRNHFEDGVLYMSVGAAATVGHLASELCKIMRVTGATTSAAEVQASKSLADAVSSAAVWFHGKRILFLIDDIWPTSSCLEGYLPELVGLLQGSPESRITTTTRSLHVATKGGGSHVDFGARDHYGPISVRIFMAHAVPEIPPSDHHAAAARSILGLCAGLPIALSVAGSAICMRMKSGLGFERACQMYFDKISVEMRLYPGAQFLETAINLSLKALEMECERTGSGIHESEFSFRDLYTSLCVLENQQFAPVPVLARMWQVSETTAETICTLFSSMSLVKFSTQTLDGCELCGLLIHDIHLEYCRQNAARSGEVRAWHRRLLNNHITINAALSDARDTDDIDGRLGLNMVEYRPRPWWQDDVANKQYIRKHLSQHLQSAGLDVELGATILDLRWISAQGAEGGILGLKNDFDILERSCEKKLVSAGSTDEQAPVKLISRIIVARSSALQMGLRVLCHVFFADLFLLGKTNAWIFQFLERVKEATPKPYLEKVVSFYQPDGEDMKFEIDYKLPREAGFGHLSTDFSICGGYGAAAVNHEVVVFSLETQNRLQWLKGHEQNVTAVKFTSDASKIISGSFDNSVIVWDWKEIDSPAQVLKGHKESITAVSLSGDDSKIFSGSRDGTLKVWDMSTGRLCRNFAYGTNVECVETSPRSDIVAVGTRDGRLQCIDWKSGLIVFQYRTVDNEAISAVRFGTDGKFLVCGSTLGNATAWRTESWKQASTVKIPGSLTNIAFHPDGTNVIIGSSQGEVRHWIVKEEALSRYNLSMARPVNGISFLNNGNDIIVGVKLGYARAWSGPQSNPNLDFEAFRNNLLFDFALSADGTRVATTTHDSMIRIWRTDTAAQIAAYAAPVLGSRCLALNSNGNKIASSSPNGVISIWNPDVSPRDADIALLTHGNSVSCLAFSPDESKFLVCLEHEVQIWNLTLGQKIGQVPSSGSMSTSFSADGRLIIVGNSTRTTIWDAAAREKVFDSTGTLPLTLSTSEASIAIRTCGPRARQMSPSSLQVSGTPSCPLQSADSVTKLTVDNFFHFVSYLFQPENMEFIEDVFVLSYYGLIGIYKLRK